MRRAAITRRLRISRVQRAEAGIALVAALRDSGLLESLRPGDTVAAYVSMGSEIPTRPLLGLLLDTGLRVLVPRLGSGMEVGWGELTDVRALRPVESDTATSATAAAAVAAITAAGGTAAADTAAADDSCNDSSCRADANQPDARPSDARLSDARQPKARRRHRPDEPDAETLEPQALRDARLILVPAFAVDRDGTRLGRGGGWYDRALMHRASGTPIVAICWPWESPRNATSALLPRRPHDVAVSGMLTPTGLTWLHS
ncbi:5-formyltetrahydrofolate cyclo-ligase [Bifidobacterium jacchi]|uniref:5-formyltetrahydrofolate cyclo-ligase n=1 Tax=Bifidobacterium jacchi TaxID=2490545 RepID=A0A5N5RLJ1_9BIFI|nr:5-formyltetrahydrofolate cyclo-ligase [Bifidobacterium jacchi]